MAMYLCRNLGGYKLTEIGKELGLENYSSVRAACLAMKGRIGNFGGGSKVWKLLFVNQRFDPFSGGGA